MFMRVWQCKMKKSWNKVITRKSVGLKKYLKLLVIKNIKKIPLNTKYGDTNFCLQRFFVI